MKKQSFFYVAYPEDQKLRDLINAIKIIADDSQRTEAHVTIRGPYSKKLPNKKVEIFSNIISNETLYISEVDNFFNYNQNTVFFKCNDNENLKRIWKKTTYAEFNPHITIYNGNNSDFAQKLYLVLSENFKPFEYKIHTLSCLQPKANDSLGIFYLKTIIKSHILKDIFDFSFNVEEIQNYTEEKRLNLIKVISNKLYNNLVLENIIM